MIRAARNPMAIKVSCKREWFIIDFTTTTSMKDIGAASRPPVV